MWLPNLKYRKRVQETQVTGVQFLGEQDGLSEREIKDKLDNLFQANRSVTAAYLAKVFYDGEPAASVALCLRTNYGPDRGLVEKVGKIFASLFGRNEHMDIVFLSDDQECELSKVCSPFYYRGP